MAAQVEIEEQESLTNLDNGEIFDSEIAGESSTVLLREGGLEHDVIKNCFISGMGPFAIDTRIVTVRKNSVESFTKKARFAAFRVFTEAMARKNGGIANVKYGWYSGSKEEIDRIVSYGFSNREIENGSHGVGIHLIHHRYSLAAAVVGEADDEQGLKHILLCRLILGKPELIVSGSKQSCPSSNQFDSGVDNLENPRKYVIWSSTMNSYILPCYVVSFTSPRIRGVARSGGGGGGLGRARSPCVSLIVLMSILTKSLDPSRMNMILTAYDAFRKRKLRREQLIRKMREVVGDYLLLEIINNHKDKA